MRKLTILYLVLVCFISMAGLGYGFMLSSDEVIAHAQNLSTTEGKRAYLLKQAQGFLHKEKYEEARNIAEYVRENFEDQSEAENIISLAQHREQTAE